MHDTGLTVNRKQAVTIRIKKKKKNGRKYFGWLGRVTKINPERVFKIGEV